jgi:hypothetical protein
VLSPVVRPLPTQDNTNTEETRTDIRASSGIRIHDPNVWAGETFHALDSAAIVIGAFSIYYSIILLEWLHRNIKTLNQNNRTLDRDTYVWMTKRGAGSILATCRLYAQSQNCDMGQNRLNNGLA